MDNVFDVVYGPHSQILYEKVKFALEGQRPLIVSPFGADLKFLQNLTFPANVILGVFTSGTISGKPRLILYTRKNIETSLNAIRKLFEIQKIDQIFCYPQPTHTFGLTLGYVQAALFNIPLTFCEGAYSTAAHEKWFASLSPGMLTLGAPVHFADLANWIQKKKLTPKKTYSAIVGGAPITRKLWSVMLQKLKIEMPSVGYGATEASPGVTHLPPGVEPSEDGDIGFVLDGVQISNSDNEGYFFWGTNLCAGLVDENGLVVPEKILIKDIILEKSKGRYSFGGRSDLLINRGGLKYSPELIEAQIFSEFGLKAACLSVFDERLGEDVGLVVQKNSDKENELELCQKIRSHLAKSFNLQVAEQKIVFATIPLNASAKFDRKEALKIILRNLNLKKPIDVKYLREYLPHRHSAIWVQRILDFKPRSGVGEVQLNLKSLLFTEGDFRETACIELIAQTFAYSKVASEIFLESSKQRANKTLIAEIRNARFYFTEENRALLKAATRQERCLQIAAECTHDFGLIMAIKGTVHLGETLLAEVSLKAFVSP